MRFIDLIEDAYRNKKVEIIDNNETKFVFVVSFKDAKYIIQTSYENRSCHVIISNLLTKGLLIADFLEGKLDVILYSTSNFDFINVKTDLEGKIVPSKLLEFAKVIYDDYNKEDNEIEYFFEYLIADSTMTALDTYFDIDTPEEREMFRNLQGYN